MRSMRTMAFLLIAAPAVAVGQVDYSTVTIIPSRPITVYRIDTPTCRDESDGLFDRKAVLDDRKADLDREADALARESGWMADELRRLDASNAGDVAAYNRRSDEHNRRVAAYNHRVARMNSEATALNADSADLLARCR